MKQLTLAAVGLEHYARTTRRAVFLAEMERVVPWLALCALIEPFYPKPGNGRPPVGVERMLRIYFLQHWFNLSDPAVEKALYDSLAMRSFVDIDLGREPVPDETTVCRFRHLLETHDLGRQLFDEVQRHLAAKGLNTSRPARSSMSRLSMRRLPLRMPTRRGIPRCIKPRRATSGISASRRISGRQHRADPNTAPKRPNYPAPSRGTRGSDGLFMSMRRSSNEPAASFTAVRMATHHGVGLSCRSGCSIARHAWRSAWRPHHVSIVRRS